MIDDKAGSSGAASSSGPRTADDPEVLKRAEFLLASGLKLSEVAKAVSVEMRVNRKELYTKLIQAHVDAGSPAGGNGGKRGSKSPR